MIAKELETGIRSFKNWLEGSDNPGSEEKNPV